MMFCDFIHIRKWYGFLLIILLFPNATLCQNNVLDSFISVSFEELPIDEVLDQISKKTGSYFSYNTSLVQQNQKFTLNLANTPVREVLRQLLIGTGVMFKTVNNQIILFRENETHPTKSYTLKGLVKDEYTDQPIVGVNVFIAGTLKGSSTNLDGVYKIEDVPEGEIELAASHIAYDIKISKIVVKGESNELAINFHLNPKVNQLRELQVVSLKYKEWDRYYTIFKQEFLGSTNNAKKCEILNPEVLDFVFNPEKNSIRVKAYKPLIIINTALGYELDYYLEYFEITDGNTRTTGVSNFKELTPKNEREKRRWRKNRLKSYQGSLTHFLRTLMGNQLENEGFKIFLMDELPYKNDVKAERTEEDSIISQFLENGIQKLKFDGYLKIVYTKETESPAYVDDQIRHAINDDPYMKNYYSSVRRGVTLGKQTSFMKLNFPEAKVSRKGFFSQQLAVTTFGYWSWERVAESLPIEFEP